MVRCICAVRLRQQYFLSLIPLLPDDSMDTMTDHWSSRDVVQCDATAAGNTGGQQQPADEQLQPQNMRLESGWVWASVLSPASPSTTSLMDFTSNKSFCFKSITDQWSVTQRMMHPKHTSLRWGNISNTTNFAVITAAAALSLLKPQLLQLCTKLCSNKWYF